MPNFEPRHSPEYRKSEKRYLKLAEVVGIPEKFRLDIGWKGLQPEPIHILEPMKRNKPIHVTPKEQKSWLRKCIKYCRFRQTGCIVVFGDYMAEAAERVAYGVFCSAIRHNLTGKIFLPVDLEGKGMPKELDGSPVQYDVILLNRIHTDDEGHRRALVRDLVNKHYEKAFKILVVYGDEPLDFFFKKVGLNPQAIFHYPFQGQKVLQDFLSDSYGEQE
jgi:hypothetical protein